MRAVPSAPTARCSFTQGTILLNSSDRNACWTGEFSVNSRHSATSKPIRSQTSRATNLLRIR